MAARVPARLTAAQGRRFGLTVGGAFIALGALLAWRGRMTGAQLTGVVGGSLILAAFLVPTRLGPIERAWMRLAHLISKVTTPITMGIIYFIVLTPIGALRRRTSSPIARPKEQSSRWQPHVPDDVAAERMEHQF